MAFQAHNFTLDDTYKLTNSLTCTGAVVTGTVAFLDLGQTSPAFNVNTSSNNPYSRFAIVVDYGVLDVVDNDEDYYIEVQGSNTSNFATTYRLVSARVGNSTNIGRPTDTPPSGRIVFYGDNAVVNSATDANSMITTRFVRLRVEAFGASPSMTINAAWLVHI